MAAIFDGIRPGAMAASAGPAMRSPRMAAAAIVLLGGVALAFGVAMSFGGGAEFIIHAALAATFALIAFGVFDFRLPVPINIAAAIATGVLAEVFLLQGASDLVPSGAFRQLAFEVLGQRLEKLLGYVFLLWCVCVLFMASRGATRVFGALVLAAVLGAEGYGIHLAAIGQPPHGALKLLFLPVFFWLLLESLQRSECRGSLT